MWWEGYNQLVAALAYYATVMAIALPLTLKWRTPYVLTSLYIASYAICQYLSPKLTWFKLAEGLGWVVPGGNVPFVATVALMDLIVITWGLGVARQVIVAGLLVQVLIYVANTLVYLTPDPFAGFEWKSYVYLASARVAVASPLAYLAAEMINAHLTWVFRRVPWKRTVYSDPVALTVDTLVFIPAAFYGVVPSGVLTDMIVGLSLLKIALIPLNLLVVYVNRVFVEPSLVGAYGQASGRRPV